MIGKPSAKDWLAPLLTAAASAAWLVFAGAPVLAAEDPFQWLEEVESEASVAWVRAENARTLPLLESDPRYNQLHEEALRIVNARDRIAFPSLRGTTVRNFWQDADQVRGLWRRTTLDSYRTDAPQWETLLDVDQLATAENANWVYKSVGCLQPAEESCLVRLSNGGKDAVVVREFDTRTKAFVAGGFQLPEGKQDVAWLDADTLLVGRDWGPGSMTPSGYPYIVKRWKRGTPLEQAVEVFRGQQSDVSASGFDLRDRDGELRATIYQRSPSFFETEYFIDNGAKNIRLPVPLKSTLQTFFANQLVFTLQQDWTWRGRTYASGTLLSLDLDAVRRDVNLVEPRVILAPGPRESIEQVAGTRDRLLVAVYENIKGALYAYEPRAGKWTRQRLPLPGNASISVTTANKQNNKIFVQVRGFLDPDALYFGDITSGLFTKVKSLPPRFDSTNMVVEQFEAKSKDGTKVPYFVVRPRDIPHDGSAPTLLTAYGGFQLSQTPSYGPMTGKMWIERGGVFVLANIRGGGEFGPAWHQAGLKTKRQAIYDDFAAVAEDLIARKITSPRRLGIQGGSNGGLLMGVEMTQRPELWRAVIINVPLLDMLRYHKLLAGASWIGEYGDPDDAVEGAFLRSISPYHNLRDGVTYPEPFFITSTKDDRVHPGHARKMAARMRELKLPFLYYENIDGGHSAAANQLERARRAALEYTYLSQKLMD